jgi:UDP-N-acetylglucosamine 2-epimerase (non-hydrolysing)
MTKVGILDLIAGARPNFMKLAPVYRAFSDRPGLSCRIVHTGQHYDVSMNDVFFKELEIPEPDVFLDVGSASHGQQTARILERYESHLFEHAPQATVVFGDVNSTVACALAAIKLRVPVIHVEAGLRSFDRSMPEEINRVLTDCIADLLFVTEPSGVENLEREGVPRDRIRLVGNVMIDTLVREIRNVNDAALQRLGLVGGSYGLVTLHRPSNVDDRGVLERLVHVLVDISGRLPLVFPAHPRTINALEGCDLCGVLRSAPGVHLIPPQPYRENLALMKNARLVLTDSGGMQEETTFLDVPCLTMRFNTERPITVERGTSRLVGSDPGAILAAAEEVLSGAWPHAEAIPLWDGKAAERVAAELTDWIES